MSKYATSQDPSTGKALFANFTPAEYEMRVERAKARARQARHDALNDFWHLHVSSASLMGRASRAALRLTHALQRHQSLRNRQGV